MKTKLILLNIVLIPLLISFVGGGWLYKWGYPFLILFLIISFIAFPKNAINIIGKPYTISLAIFLIYYFIFSSFNINGTLAQFTFFSPIYIYFMIQDIIAKNSDLRKIQLFFVYSWISIFLIYCYLAYLFLQIDPMGMRRLTSEIKDDSFIVGGGYVLIYALCILVPVIIQSILQSKSNAQKTLLFLSCLFMTFIIVKSLFTTAVLITIIGLIWAFTNRWNTKRKIAALLIIIPSCIILYEFIPLIIQSISSEDNNVMMRRFEEINSLLSGNNLSQSEDFYSRVMLTVQSLETFLEHPIFGVGPLVNFSFYGMEKMGVGSHAEWFDIFARYGIFAIFIVLCFFQATPRTVKKSISVPLFVIIGFLNPNISFPIIFATFCLSPLLYNLIYRKSGHRYCNINVERIRSTNDKTKNLKCNYVETNSTH